MPTLLELREYEERRVEIPLGEEQLRALSEAHIGVTPLSGDAYTLRPESLVGVLSLGDHAVVVRPKIPIDRVMFMISYVLDIGDWRQDDAPLAEDADLLEAIIPAFVHHTRRAIRRGLLQATAARTRHSAPCAAASASATRSGNASASPYPSRSASTTSPRTSRRTGCSRPRSTSWAACPSDHRARGDPCVPCARPSRRSGSARTGGGRFQRSRTPG